MSISHKLCVAPMVRHSDCHFRYLMRLMSQQAVLYTEMVVDQAMLFGQPKALTYHDSEHPIALQVAGRDPGCLARCAQLASQLGYDEINLNVGCPSHRVGSARIGACLMLEPDIIARCVEAMCQASSLPVTVKTRLGVDDHDAYPLLYKMIQKVREAGCKTCIIHARKAWLTGLNPKQNRHIPPLRYDWVWDVKQDFPDLAVVINGGIKTLHQVQEHLDRVDGIMLGRIVLDHPFFLAEVEVALSASDGQQDRSADHLTPTKLMRAFIPYVLDQRAQGVNKGVLLRPVLQLFCGRPKAKHWRQTITACIQGNEEGFALKNKIEEALDWMTH